MRQWVGPALLCFSALLVLLASWYPDKGAFLPAGLAAGVAGFAFGFRLNGVRIGVALVCSAIPLMWLSQFAGHALFGQRLSSCGADYLQLVKDEQLGVTAKPESWGSNCPLPLQVVKDQQDGVSYVDVEQNSLMAQ